jgi:hypothetical protein
MAVFIDEAMELRRRGWCRGVAIAFHDEMTR